MISPFTVIYRQNCCNEKNDAVDGATVTETQKVIEAAISQVQFASKRSSIFSDELRFNSSLNMKSPISPNAKGP